MIVLIDNYDSFTFNLVHYLGGLGADVVVHRNDKISAADVMALDPDAIVLSPGPCTPTEAGICLELIGKAAKTIPILGVCLGHQAIGAAFGGRIVRAGRLMHGKTSPIFHDNRTIFHGLSQPFEATRYHSLLIERATMPACLELSAWTAEGEIMGVRHREFLLEGIQFHPESILTVEGKHLLKNFLDLTQRAAG